MNNQTRNYKKLRLLIIIASAITLIVVAVIFFTQSNNQNPTPNTQISENFVVASNPIFTINVPAGYNEGGSFTNRTYTAPEGGDLISVQRLTQITTEEQKENFKQTLKQSGVREYREINGYSVANFSSNQDGKELLTYYLLGDEFAWKITFAGENNSKIISDAEKIIATFKANNIVKSIVQ